MKVKAFTRAVIKLTLTRLTNSVNGNNGSPTA